MAGAAQLLAGSAYIGLPSTYVDSFVTTNPAEFAAFFNLNELGLLEISKVTGGGVLAVAQSFAVPKAAYPFSSDIRFVSISGAAPDAFSVGMGSGTWVTLGSTLRFVGYSRVAAGTTTGVFDIEIRNSVSLAELARCRFDFTLTTT